MIAHNLKILRRNITKRKNAFLDTAYGLTDAAKLQYTEDLFENTEPAKNYMFPQSGIDVLKFSGNKPQGEANREQVTIPEGVTTIGDHALNEPQLKAVTLPSTLTTIGSNAFSKNKLTSVVIPSNVTNIESLAFYSNALTNIEIPNKVTKIERYAFSDNQLTELDLSTAIALQKIGIRVFAANQLSQMTFGAIEGLTTIDSGVFCNTRNTILTYDHIPSSVITMDFNVSDKR